MSPLILEHVKLNDLPYGWVKQLPPAQTVTVTIVVENIEPQNVIEDKEMYLQYLRSQGVNIGRLEESIKQLKAGEVETVTLDDLDDFIENAKTNTKIGIGKPEGLKYKWSGYWSHRIDKENRLVYKFDDNLVYLVQAKGHYPNPPDEYEIEDAKLNNDTNQT
jgi:toxin YoeB